MIQLALFLSLFIAFIYLPKWNKVIHFLVIYPDLDGLVCLSYNLSVLSCRLVNDHLVNGLLVYILFVFLVKGPGDESN